MEQRINDPEISDIDLSGMDVTGFGKLEGLDVADIDLSSINTEGFGALEDTQSVEAGESQNERSWWNAKFGNLAPGTGTAIKEGFKQTGYGVNLQAIDDQLEYLERGSDAPYTLPGISSSNPTGINPIPIKLRTDERRAELIEELKVSRFKALEKYGQSQEKIELLTPENLTVMEEGIRGGVISTAQMLPSLLASLAARNPTPMLLQGSMQGKYSGYVEGRSKGLNPNQAAIYGNVLGAIEGATELIPGKHLVDAFGGKLAGKKITKALLKFAIWDMGGEQTATALETLTNVMAQLDEQLLDPNLSAEEKAKIVLRRQAVTAIATVVGASSQAGTVQGLSAALKSGGKISESHEADILNEVEGVEASQDQINQFVQEETAIIEEEIANGTLVDEVEIESRNEAVLREAQELSASGELDQMYPTESFTERELLAAEAEMDSVETAPKTVEEIKQSDGDLAQVDAGQFDEKAQGRMSNYVANYVDRLKIDPAKDKEYFDEIVRSAVELESLGHLESLENLSPREQRKLAELIEGEQQEKTQQTKTKDENAAYEARRKEGTDEIELGLMRNLSKPVLSYVKEHHNNIVKYTPRNTAMSEAMKQAVSVRKTERNESAVNKTPPLKAETAAPAKKNIQKKEPAKSKPIAPPKTIKTEAKIKAVPANKIQILKNSTRSLEKSVGVKINTFESVNELPENFKRQIEKDGNSKKVKGFYDPESGEVFMVGENIKDEQEAAKLYLHEVVGHKGFRAATGKSLNITLSRVFQSLPKEAVSTLSDKYHEQLNSMSQHEQQRLIAEEYIAELAETDPNNNLVQQVVAAIRRWARTKMPNIKFSDQDIIDLLRQGKKKLKTESQTKTENKKTGAEKKTKEKILSSLKNIPEVTRKILAQNDLLLGWTMLAQHDDAFKSPVSTKTTLEEIFKDTAKGIEIKRDPDMEIEGKNVWRFTLQGHPDSYGYVFQKKDEVWIDVSEWGRGAGGSLIYNAVANYAFNNRKVFVGDPEGLSNDGLARRLENMASSALKFGTTEHLWPHKRQEEGSKVVPGIKWKDGDDANNIREMFKASYAAVKAQFPEIVNIVYNVDNRRFEDKQGNEYTDRQFNAATTKKAGDTQKAGGRNTNLRGVGSTSTVGRTTYKRAVFGQAFISGKSEEQSKLLVQLSGKLPVPLKELLYSLDDGPRRQTFSVPKETRVKKIQRTLQDKLTPVSTTQKSITKVHGELADSLDVRTIEDLSSGKTEQDITVFRLEHVEPLMKAMANLKITQEELDLYLIARHAEERNIHIASINSRMPDGGSGMMTEQANAVLKQFASEGKTRNLLKLTKRVDAMTQVRRDILKNHDLVEEAQVNAWQAQYKFYVPLKGEKESQNGESPRPATGKGFDIRGKESMQAMGRRTMADSPLASIIQDATTTMIRRRNNEVGISMLKLIEQHPNNTYWKIYDDTNKDTRRAITRSETEKSKLARKAALKQNLATVRAGTPKGLSKAKRDTHIRKGVDKLGLPRREFKREVKDVATNMGDKYFAVKRNGKQYYVWSSDTNLINAMKNLGPEKASVLVKTLGSITRFLSSVYTSFSLGFILTNPVRDIQTAVYNALAEQELSDGKIKGKKIVTSMVANVPKSIRAIWRHQRQKPVKGEYQTYYTEFLEDGAKTGYYDSKDINGVVKDIQKLMGEAQGGAKGSLLKFKRASLNVVEHSNTALENGVRLSSYVNARKAGVSRQKAASLAKNLTVNFNRRGEMGSNLNAMYMFFNASVQGTANFSRAMIQLADSPKGKALSNLGTGKKLNTAQKVAVGLGVSGYFWSQLMREMAGEDDDGENYYDKVPQHVRERHFVIMKSAMGVGDKPEDYWKIPMPYGYNIFWAMGDSLEAAAHSESKKRNAALMTNLALTMMGSFSPLSMHASVKSDARTEEGKAVSAPGTLAKTAIPSAFQILVQLGMNEDTFGTPVYRQKRDWELRSDAYQGFDSTPVAYRATSIFLNDVMGDGSKYESGGWWDIHPEKIEHLFKFTLGGIYTEAEKIAKTAAAATEGRELKAHNIPVINRFTGTILPFEDKSTFYDRKARIEHLNKSVRKLGNTSEGWELRKKYSEILQLKNPMERASKQLKKMRVQIERIKARKLSPAEEEKQINKVREREEREIDRFNKIWNDQVGRD